jgi:hypothetical protein
MFWQDYIYISLLKTKYQYSYVQGCQIFLATTYQNGEKLYQLTIKFTKCPKIYQMAVHKIYQRLPLQRPSKIDPNLDFWFENIPSGNPVYVGAKREKLYFCTFLKTVQPLLNCRLRGHRDKCNLRLGLKKYVHFFLLHPS